jgi:hypothetical protein
MTEKTYLYNATVHFTDVGSTTFDGLTAIALEDRWLILQHGEETFAWPRERIADVFVTRYEGKPAVARPVS